MSDSTVRHITEDERARESTAWPRGYLWKVQPDEMTPEEALHLLWQVAIQDPHHSDMARLVEARLVLERALGIAKD